MSAIFCISIKLIIIFDMVPSALVTIEIEFLNRISKIEFPEPWIYLVCWTIFHIFTSTGIVTSMSKHLFPIFIFYNYLRFISIIVLSVWAGNVHKTDFHSLIINNIFIYFIFIYSVELGHSRQPSQSCIKVGSLLERHLCHNIAGQSLGDNIQVNPKSLLYGPFPDISTIWHEWSRRFAEHFYVEKQELANDLLFWMPNRGAIRVGRPTTTFTDQLL